MHKLEAKVKDNYALGPVIAFSGHEFIRGEWRPVPEGFEPAAVVHPLLDTREAQTREEIHVTAKDQLAAWQAEGAEEAAVATVTEPEEEEPKTKRRSTRKSKATSEE